MKAQLTFEVAPGTSCGAMVDEIAERYAVDADVQANFHAQSPEDSDVLERLVAHTTLEIERVEIDVPS